MQKNRTYLTYRTYFVFLILFAVTSTVSAQRPGERPTRDTTDRLSRIDTNRAADLQIIKGEKNDGIIQAILKQINEDFRGLQSVNNKMMADTSASAEIDYKFVSVMISQIAKKATRLKQNLALPKSEDIKVTKEPEKEIATEKDFKAELLLLDSSVMRFVTNPIFQQTNVVELKLANQASSDLETIINLSKRLKKGSRLTKTAK
ncbi:MAG TPA: hypothetical protein VIG25_08090 [Pyrinomonadaceae bacterium]